MKRVQVTGAKTCVGEGVPEPRVAENYAKIKIHASPLCTEYVQFVKGNVGPLFGHEAAGEVVEVGPLARHVKVGDRVVVMPDSACGACSLCTVGDHIFCQNKKDANVICGSELATNTYAQYCVQQDWLLLPIPDDISYDHGSMACCGVGPAFNAMQSMNVVKTDTVLVSGLGPVGLGAVVMAAYRGARILGLETNPYRIALAKDIGVETIVDPASEDALDQIRALTHGVGADKSVECSSARTAPAFLVEATRPRGQIASIGWGGPMDASELVRRGLTYHGCWHWNHQRDGEAMMRTIRGAKDLINKQITHTFPLSQLQEAFETRASGNCGKIVLHPWEGE
ncbi:MAG: zinc-binding dehydrogenase [Verrucomicrobia bacterium]|nr:zinc-binding dehydrogenase [Verrucomicrobiota bacterium]